MDHADHVSLLRDGVPDPGGVWADMGAGTGAFTLALAELISPGGIIYAVDRDGRALTQTAETMARRYPGVELHARTADFTQPLDLPPLDGIVAANALHFVRQKGPALALLRGYLKPGGRLLLVEYNTDRGNMWVPHPFSYGAWVEMANRAGFGRTALLATRPSRFLGEIYSAVSL